ncbi:hypothetical protein GVN24_29325 [Rhizobium sp. CRIBSB]|nr:hypothetical protein [Rhizobium sp. CRIBSB]
MYFKALIFAAVLAVPFAAQAQTPPTAAATLPNAFAPSGSRSPVAPAPPPAVAVMEATPLDDQAEPAIRAIVAGAQAGAIDYSVFSDDLAAVLRQQEADAIPLLQGFGEIVSILPVRRQDGANLLRVIFENADTQWVIGFYDDGRIGLLQFRPTPITPADAAPAPSE